MEISTVILLPSTDSFKKGCCQVQAKVCARITGQPLVQACPGKSVVRWTDRPAMTIAVDLGRKATKQTNKQTNSNRTFCKQTVETLIRCSILLSLFWVCAVCLCPTKRTLGLYGLIFVMWMSVFCVSSSRCHWLVFDLWLGHFLVIFTCCFSTWGRKKVAGNHTKHLSFEMTLPKM